MLEYFGIKSLYLRYLYRATMKVYLNTIHSNYKSLQSFRVFHDTRKNVIVRHFREKMLMLRFSFRVTIPLKKYGHISAIKTVINKSRSTLKRRATSRDTMQKTTIFLVIYIRGGIAGYIYDTRSSPDGGGSKPWSSAHLGEG